LVRTGQGQERLRRIVEWIMEMGGGLPGEGAIYWMEAV